MANIIITIFVIVFCIAYAGMLFKFLTRPKFIRGRNPFTRTCKKCGAIQDQFQMGMDSSYTWWQEISPGNDPNCKCKNETSNPLPGW